MPSSLLFGFSFVTVFLSNLFLTDFDMISLTYGNFDRLRERIGLESGNKLLDSLAARRLCSELS